ncbi:MAG: TVP38/TMEM64 family protein [cyanobacterium endosymbiont of Rhopalodia musculus]|uniref:TVP38/TMEM64 family protein n=1 Tax=cyanobacterium endosymbiont of Epithemia clementina EcSB TaxID=3034674 RepID=UPI00248017D3|nr:TVP38/TMEM64 family protein [cyanobacterium endosymbiont of Epithemia clementina EcSB]WGT66792.1 TVP38/TMEM64 family protein [cyanobacterium endosymbiont of Epithemia clementina EcSB]
MTKGKQGIILLTIFCLAITGIGVVLIWKFDLEELQVWLNKIGILAPIIYVVLYILTTLLILPSTPLNLSGGALFGIGWGVFWTTIAAMLAAILSFAFTRTLGRKYVMQKLAGKWEAIDAEIRQGGLFYLFAIRLLPIIPYGIVNLTAGLTSIRFQDYLIGTTLGTIPGILPFVMIGAGFKSLNRGNILPLLCGFTLTGILVGVSAWYRRRRKPPHLNKAKQ